MSVRLTVFKRYALFYLLTIGGLFIYSSPGQTGDFPVQVTDAMGRNVAINKKPERIVTVFSSNTEIVAALGLSRAIVGIDGYTYYPESIKDVPKIGGRLGFFFR